MEPCLPQTVPGVAGVRVLRALAHKLAQRPLRKVAEVPVLEILLNRALPPHAVVAGVVQVGILVAWLSGEKLQLVSAKQLDIILVMHVAEDAVLGHGMASPMLAVKQNMMYKATRAVQVGIMTALLAPQTAMVLLRPPLARALVRLVFRVTQHIVQMMGQRPARFAGLPVGLRAGPVAQALFILMVLVYVTRRGLFPVRWAASLVQHTVAANTVSTHTR
jgi:hypothetical protein